MISSLYAKFPRRKSNVICADDVISGTAEAWRAPHSIPVRKTAQSLAGCVAPMLSCATRILFIAPYFNAVKPEFNKPLSAFIKIVISRNPQATIELHAADHQKAKSFQDFEKDCKTYLPRYVPAGITLIVRRWKKRKSGEGLHNRFILTDIGGVKFPWGISEGELGTSDDVSLLDDENYRLRMQQYNGPAYAFDPDGQFKIIGTA